MNGSLVDVAMVSPLIDSLIPGGGTSPPPHDEGFLLNDTLGYLLNDTGGRLIIRTGAPPPESSFLLNDTGGFFLNDTGGKLIIKE